MVEWGQHPSLLPPSAVLTPPPAAALSLCPPLALKYFPETMAWQSTHHTIVGLPSVGGTILTFCMGWGLGRLFPSVPTSRCPEITLQSGKR